jgi:hypothetical protein
MTNNGLSNSSGAATRAISRAICQSFQQAQSGTKVMRDALRRFALAISQGEGDYYRAALDLLNREEPRVGGHSPGVSHS